MARERVTVGQGVPTQWRLVLDHPDFAASDLSSLRIAGTGAATVPPELVREMEQRLGCPVVIGYTSTEAAITTGTVPGDSPEVISQTVGPAARQRRARGGRRRRRASAPTGDVGRVRCRSDAVMRGYWHDPERTAEVLGAGRLAHHRRPRISRRARLPHARRPAQRDVHPRRLQRVPGRGGARPVGAPAVAQVAVLGVPDPVLGEIGVAFVVADAGTGSPSSTTSGPSARPRSPTTRRPTVSSSSTRSR